MPKVRIYTTDYCPYCDRAKGLLTRLGIDFEEIDLTHNDELRNEISKKAGMRTVPMIFFDEKCIGGSDDLHEFYNSGELKKIFCLS
jgi:glutaredoxin 3